MLIAVVIGLYALAGLVIIRYYDRQAYKYGHRPLWETSHVDAHGRTKDVVVQSVLWYAFAIALWLPLAVYFWTTRPQEKGGEPV